MIKKLLNKIEINKFNKLINNKSTIPIVSVYDRNKKYRMPLSLN